MKIRIICHVHLCHSGLLGFGEYCKNLYCLDLSVELKIKHEPLYKLEADIQDSIKSLTDTTFSKLINFIMINTECEVLKRTLGS